MSIKTPSYWNEEKFLPHVEEKTAKGNSVMIPQKLKFDWEMERERMIFLQKNPNAVIGENSPNTRTEYLDMAQVFYETYQEEN